MHALVTGVTGLIGRYLVEQRPDWIGITGISRSTPGFAESYLHVSADLTDAGSLAGILESTHPDSIIHCAAEGQVDAVEGRMDEFSPMNVQVTQQLASYYGRTGIPFVFISSNAVFGRSPEPYSDYSKRDPINDYGRLKVEAEDYLLGVKPDALLVRPILMYGWPGPGHRLNPVVTWIEHLRQGKAHSVVEDVWTQPSGPGTVRAPFGASLSRA